MSTLVTGEAVELSVQPAALAARALSCLIDVVAYTLVNIGLLLATFWLLLRILDLNGLLLTAVMTIMSVSVFVLLPMLVEVLTRGRSLGKLILGLRIVRDDGGSWDVGYPNAYEVEPGRIGAIYYFNSKDDPMQVVGGSKGGVRHIARSIFTVD